MGNIVHKEHRKENWQIKKLNDVSKKISLNKLKIKQRDYLTNGLFPVVDQGQDLIGGYYNDESLLISEEPPFVVFGDHTKVKKFISFKFIPGADGVKVLKAKESILPKFLYYLLFTIKIEDKGYARHFQLLEKESFLIPKNTETQQAIVSKIEELFSELDKGIEDLKTAQKQLKTYRQGVLKWAFEGKLTETWRLKQDNLPSSIDINNKILLEKETFYLSLLNDWKEEIIHCELNNIKKPSKPKSLTIPDKPSDLHNDKKWKIPSNWLWTQLGTICFVTKLAGFEYTDYVKYEEEGDLPVLKAENVGNNGFKYTDFSRVKSESVEMLKRSKLNGGELLVVFVGAGTGNIGTVPKGKYFLGPNIGMARPYIDINSKYIEYFYQSSNGKSLMMTAVKAVAQPSLSMGTIRQAPIPIPTLEEQHQIVQEIESRLSVADKMEESIAQSLQQAEALWQSILKKAFSGELV